MSDEQSNSRTQKSQTKYEIPVKRTNPIVLTHNTKMIIAKKRSQVQNVQMQLLLLWLLYFICFVFLSVSSCSPHMTVCLLCFDISFESPSFSLTVRTHFFHLHSHLKLQTNVYHIVYANKIDAR